jgi:REP element-mobilizing transposase RayT
MPDARLNRRSVRPRDYDNAQAGAYFVTICTYQRAPILGWIIDGGMWLGARSQIVEACWAAISEHFPQVELDSFVVMPNHLHRIILIGDLAEDPALRPAETGATCRAPTPGRKPRLEGRTLDHVVRAFKAASTKALRELEMDSTPELIWQRGYHEHLFRGEAALARISQYIADNPAIWAFDHDNPAIWQ